MTLKEYMTQNSISLRKMAVKTGIDFRVLHRYTKGYVRPNLINAHKIYLATRKRVRISDWFKEEEIEKADSSNP